MTDSIAPDTLPSRTPHILTIDQLTEKHLRETLPLVQWNYSVAAHVLGIDRRTLYRWCKRYQIARDVLQQTDDPPATSETA